MKFAQHLSAHLTPEWRKQYIDYDMLKDLLYRYLEEAPEADAEPSERQKFLAQKTSEFLEQCTEELEKINLFFAQKMSEAKTKWHDINHQVHDLKKRLGCSPLEKTAVTSESRKESRKESNSVQLKEAWKAQKLQKLQESVRFAFTEYYLSLILIQNFQELNFTGFRKILKKHDKLLQTTEGMQWRQNNIFTADFYTDKSIDELIHETEKTFIELEGGNRSKAMSRLRVQPMSEKQSPWTTFRLGLFLGCFLVIAAVIGFTIAFRDMPNEPRWVGVRLFRGFSILFAHAFLFGLNVYGWQTSGVNHVLIFEINPRDHLRYQTAMEIAVTLIFVWSACALAYLFHDKIHLPKLLMPLLLVIFILLWMLNPFDFAYRSSRYWLLRKIYLCFTPLCHPVVFADFWLADQMNSLVTVFLDFEYFVCFYIFEVDWLNGMQIKFKPPSNITSHSQVPMDYKYQGHTSFADYGVDPYTGKDICSSSVFGIRPLIAIIPAAIRFFQCIRRYADSDNKHHLWNAGKYSTTFFVVFFGTLTTWHAGFMDVQQYETGFFYVWVVSYLVSTGYTYCWDILMDWGLCDCKNAGDNKYLREELVYRKKSYYYFAMVSDLLLRFGWTLNVSLGELWVTGDILVCITAALECFRRFVWNFFRLENEHLNNCGEFRAVRDISLKPIPWSVQDITGTSAGGRSTVLGKRVSRALIQDGPAKGFFGRLLPAKGREKGGFDVIQEDNSEYTESERDVKVLVPSSSEHDFDNGSAVSRRSSSSGSGSDSPSGTRAQLLATV